MVVGPLVKNDYEQASLKRAVLAPLIASELANARIAPFADDPDARLEGVRIADERVSGTCFAEIEVAGARFMGAGYSGCDFSRALFTDVAFEGCDLSNAVFDRAGFVRCCFRDCKLTGASFLEASLGQVELTACALPYSAFNASSWKAVRARQCDFTAADLSEMTLRHVAFDDDRFIAASFFRTKLVGIDLTTSYLEDVSFSEGMGEFYATKMTLYQAASLARRLGVIVEQ